MKTKISVILFLFITIEANAGDTIFNTPPNTRLWNPVYVQQKFNDEFNGTNLNTNFWDIDLCESRGYQGNNEGEPNNIIVSNGTLKLTARNSPGNIDNNCWRNNHFVSNYTTAEIWSKWNNYRYKYGSFEARCFMPRGDHYYYAYWLWGPGGGGYPQDGFTSEIDITEGTAWEDGSHHEMKSTFHLWPQTGGAQIPLPGDASSGFGTSYEGAWHIYKIEWNPFEVIFYIDSNEVWRRSKYYTGSDLKANDVGMNQLQTNITYHKRDWFPNDEMITIFQMHVTNGIASTDLPASMEVDYVRVKQYFLAPEITCPQIICSSGTATMDVDPAATNISWALSPGYLFSGATTGSGTTTNIVASSSQGKGKITYTFNMPSGETFSAEKEIWIKGPDASETSFDVYNSNGVRATKVGNTFLMCPNTTYHIYAMNSGPVPLSNYTWTVPSAWTQYYTSGNMISVNTNSSPGGPVTVNATNTASGCNNTVQVITGYMGSNYSCGSYYMALSPNPSTGETAVTLSADGEKVVNENTSWDVQVYDQQFGLKEKKTKLKGKEAKLNTSGWKDGVYIVNAIVDGQKISEKLVVKH